MPSLSSLMATPLSPRSARDFVVARIPLTPFTGPPATRENENVCTEQARASVHEDALLACLYETKPLSTLITPFV